MQTVIQGASIGILVDNIIKLLTQPLVLFILGIITSIFVSVTTRLMLLYIRRPKLHFRDFYYSQREDKKIMVGEVENDGYKSANNCSVYLSLNNLTNSDIISNENCEAIIETIQGNQTRASLMWMSRRSGDAQDMNRDDILSFKICEFTGEKVLIPSESGWEKPKVALRLGNLPYDATIQVTTANSSQVREKVNIRHLQIEPEEHQIRHFTRIRSICNYLLRLFR